MAGLVPFNKSLFSMRPKGFEDFYNMLDDFFSDSWSSRSLAGDTFKVDIQENEKEYQIEAELPGVKKEEINLDLSEDGRFSVSVKRDENIKEEKKNYIHRERRFKSMQRSVYLAGVKNDEVKAKLEDGVLKIIVPKQEKIDKTQRIAIE